MLSMQGKFYKDDKMWWNKLNNMTDADFKMMPYGFVKKYGSIMFYLKKQQEEFHLDENLSMNGYFKQVKNLQGLMTD